MYTYMPAYASLQYLFLKKILDLEGCLSTLAAVFFILGQALTYRLASIVLTVKVFTLLIMVIALSGVQFGLKSNA